MTTRFRKGRSTVYTVSVKKCRKLETNIPRKGIAQPSPNFHIHVSICLWAILYIPTIDLPILLQDICGPILGIYKSLTDTWRWKLGLRPHNSQKRNTQMRFSLQCWTTTDLRGGGGTVQLWPSIFVIHNRNFWKYFVDIWERGLANFFFGIHKSEIVCSVSRD